MPLSQASLSNTRGKYEASVGQSSEDYDRIMRGYEQLRQPRTTTPLQYTPITPKFSEYMKSPNLSSAMSQAQSLASSGGYSEEGIRNIRERGISPIRSIYSNAMRNLGRQRSLQGGYSPNYGAVQARMSRDLSEQLSSRTTDVNARIAEMQAEGKRSGLSMFAPLAARQAEE